MQYLLSKYLDVGVQLLSSISLMADPRQTATATSNALLNRLYHMCTVPDSTEFMRDQLTGIHTSFPEPALPGIGSCKHAGKT